MSEDALPGLKFRVHPITKVKHLPASDDPENIVDYQENREPSEDGESNHEEN